jgi:hypothetical protein
MQSLVHAAMLEAPRFAIPDIEQPISDAVMGYLR